MTTVAIPEGYRRYGYNELLDLFKDNPWELHEVDLFYKGKITKATFYPTGNTVKHVYTLSFRNDEGHVINFPPKSLYNFCQEYTFVHP